MDRLTAPPIRTALQSEDAKQNTTKEWYLFWNNSATQINQQAQTLAQQGAILAELVTHGTHANRPDPSTMPDGALYVEDDRGALYENRSGTWYFVAGTMWGTISPDQRPADLGANDQSFHFQATTTPPREFIWSGTIWIETTGLLDPTTTLGDLLVRGSSIVTRLGKGTNGQVLTANAGAPLGVDWEVPPGGSGSTSGVISAFGRIGNVVGATGDYTVAQVTNAVANTRQVLAGTGLTGGGALSADVTLAAVPMGASGSSHAAGVVPDPGSTAGSTRYLREDATWAAPAGGGTVTSVFTRTGAVVAASGDYTVAQVTNAVANTRQVLAGAGMTGGGTLAADVTLTAKAFVASGASHALGAVPDPGSAAGTTHYLREDATWAVPPIAAVSSVFTRTGAVVSATGDYVAAQITNAVDSTQTYANPAWITALAWGKITGAPAFLTALTPWTTNINAAGFQLLGAGSSGFGTSSPGAPVDVSVTIPSQATYQSQWWSTSSANYALKLQTVWDANGIYAKFVHRSAGTDSNTLYLAGPNVGIGIYPTFLLQLSADSAAKPSTNTWTISSDMRTKRNVSRFEGDIEVIRRLDPIVAEYNGKAGTPDGARVVSFDAERLREIVPAAVSSVRGKLNPEDAEETDLLGVNTHEVFFQMLRAIQHLDREVEELKRKLAA